MHLYLIRHADPIYDPDELTSIGHKEAEALAPRLKNYGVNRIFSSNMTRTLQTAQYSSDLLSIPIEVKPWLMEPAQIRINQNGFDYVIWDTYGEKIRSGETLPGHDDWQKREPFDKGPLYKDWLEYRETFDKFLGEFGYHREGGRYRVDKRTDDRIAIFCHNGSLLMTIAHLLEIPLPLVFSGLYCWPCSLTDIYFDQRSDKWAVPRALHVADVSHLAMAGLKPQARGMGDRCDEYY